MPEKPTLYEAMMGEVPLRAAIKPTGKELLAMVASDLDLSGLEVELPRQPGWQGALRRTLEGVDGYDYMVIDTAPGLGVLPYVALVASTVVLVVTPPEFLAYRALPMALETIEEARQQSPGLRLLGIVPNFASRQSRHAREVLEVLREDYGDLVLPEIPRRVAAQDSVLGGQPVRDYAPGSDLAVAFANLTKEVIARAQAA